ncbi:sensor histidine kinase [Halorientalis regularis]|jgi:signal transduction histidine kinase|uniref:histidine kinase n=1 Tax=Halorientalis regularis TaxID=660518 RepID=A0A1G7M6A3_9EURY|nr:ATP-binding protein [Halorientalis regularis]SDF57126.1 His Kinase A (phospho-acceptor) domain-containing protein [Halorientalis regularis]
MAGEDAPPVDAESVEDLLDRMTDAFMGLDDEWRFTYLNEQGRRVVCEATGTDLTVEELQGRTMWDTIPALEGTIFEDRYREAMASQSPVSFEAEYEPLGAWFEINVYPSDSGLSVYFRDVTERRQRRRALEKRETVLREMYEVISDQALSFEGRVEELLAIGCRELGVEYGTLSRVRDDEYVFEVVQAPGDVLESGDVVDLEETHCERVVLSEERLVTGDVAADHPDLTDGAGYREWGINCYLGTPVVVDGDVYGTFCFYDAETMTRSFSEWEITLVDTMGRWIGSALERKLATERLGRQNERLEQFATIVSHDLRNPLGVAQKRLDLVTQDCESEHLAEVERAHDRMETLIDDVLEMTRVGETVENISEVTMAAVARDAWDSVRTGDASLDVDEELVVSCDRSRLRQLLENLFRNSVEHGTEGEDSVTVQIADRPGGFVVADDGSGIPESERDSVFEFGHSGSGGSGVGLAIVEQIATAHGWEVTLTDDWDGGARFEFQTTADR